MSSSTDGSAPASPLGTLLLVDDDADMLNLLRRWLTLAGYTVRAVDTAREALTQVAVDRPDLVLTDLRMDEMDGFDLLAQLSGVAPGLPVVMLSGEAGIPDAVRATNLGSVAFLTKPPERNLLLEEVQRQLQRAGPARSVRHPFAANFIHRSSRIEAVLEEAELLAGSDLSVMILGETGVGKEVLARAIHTGSPRAAGPFVGVNCGAIPEPLLESELFGHERGAFTGASTRHEGLFVAANGGTLFLDEVGDMPLALQVKLLRVLQELAVRPVGAVSAIPVDVRIIAATHQDLDKQVAAGEFREDLYYRLNAVTLQIPSLADRREDIPLLIDHFLDRYAIRTRGTRKRFAPEALDQLIAAPWPGNVRQLINVVEQCATLNRGEVIPLAATTRALRGQAGPLLSLKDARDAFERDYLISVMRLANGNVATASRLAGRNRTEFYKLLEHHRIEAAQFREDLKPS